MRGVITLLGVVAGVTASACKPVPSSALPTRQQAPTSPAPVSLKADNRLEAAEVLPPPASRPHVRLYYDHQGYDPDRPIISARIDQFPPRMNCLGRGPDGTPDGHDADDVLAKMRPPASLRSLNLDAAATDAGLAQIGEMTQLRHLSLARLAATSEGFRHLAKLENLHSLAIRDGVPAGALAHLARLPKLRVLDLESRGVPDASFEHVGAMTGLWELHLWPTRIGDAGLAHLKGLTELRQLDLPSSRATDAGLAHLAGMKDLRKLNLSYSAVTDAGLAHLKAAVDLEELDVSGTKVTGRAAANFSNLTRLNMSSVPLADADMPHVARLRKLRQLWITNTAVTDAGLKHLAGMPALRDIGWPPAVTNAAANALVDALPAMRR